jgi:hypothetical protein
VIFNQAVQSSEEHTPSQSANPAPVGGRSNYDGRSSLNMGGDRKSVRMDTISIQKNEF